MAGHCFFFYEIFNRKKTTTNRQSTWFEIQKKNPKSKKLSIVYGCCKQCLCTFGHINGTHREKLVDNVKWWYKGVKSSSRNQQKKSIVWKQLVIWERHFFWKTETKMLSFPFIIIDNRIAFHFRLTEKQQSQSVDCCCQFHYRYVCVTFVCFSWLLLLFICHCVYVYVIFQSKAMKKKHVVDLKIHWYFDGDNDDNNGLNKSTAFVLTLHNVMCIQKDYSKKKKKKSKFIMGNIPERRREKKERERVSGKIPW